MKQLAHMWAEKPSDPNEDPEVGEEAERLANEAYQIVDDNIELQCVPDHENGFLHTRNEVFKKKGLLELERKKNSELIS